MAIPNAKVLGDVGVDKVNMIPYGKRTDKEKQEDDLKDFIYFFFTFGVK